MYLLHRPSPCTGPNVLWQGRHYFVLVYCITSFLNVDKKNTRFSPIMYSISNKGPIAIRNLKHATSKNFYYCTLMLSASYIQRKQQEGVSTLHNAHSLLVFFNSQNLINLNVLVKSHEQWTTKFNFKCCTWK
jgi:hypothetical protein